MHKNHSQNISNVEVVIAIIFSLFISVHCQNMTVTTSSAVVGQPSNYTYTLQGLNNVLSVEFVFQDWSPRFRAPYQSSSLQILVQNTPTQFDILPPNNIRCQFSIQDTSRLTFTLTNMLNPSSTKPYLLTLIAYMTSTSVSFTQNLTLTQLRDYPFVASSYNRSLSATSSSVIFSFTNQIRMTFQTILRLNYDPSIVSISLNSNSLYVVQQNVNGTILITNWNNFNDNILSIIHIQIVNPPASLNYAITGQFYYVQSNITYRIMNVSLNVAVTVLPFMTLNSNSTLRMGVVSDLAITQSCGVAQVNLNSTIQAYSMLTYNSSQIVPLASSSCTSQVNSTCRYNNNNSSVLSNFRVLINSFSSVSIVVTSYTYFRNILYPLCNGTLNIPVTQQLITPLLNLNQCDSSVVQGTNFINISTNVSSLAVGDLVYISGFAGTIINTNLWSSTMIGSVNWFVYTLLASQLTNNNTLLTVPLQFMNPSSTINNSITGFAIYRGSVAYASIASNSSLPICPVTVPLTISSFTQTSASLVTYTTNSITLSISMRMFDYTSSDYLTISFNSANRTKQFILSSFYINLAPSITFNSRICPTVLTNTTTLQAFFTNITVFPTSSSSTITLVIRNIINPPFVGNVWLTLHTFSGRTGGIKQALVTSPISFTASSMPYTFPQLSLLANNTLTLTLKNANRVILLQNRSIQNSSLVIRLPSQLTCPTATNNTINIQWKIGVTTATSFSSGNTTHLSVDLGTCFVSYFSTSPSISIQQRYNNISSTNTIVPLINRCGTNCQECSSSSVCTNCFNSSFTIFVNLYKRVCYSVCPDGSYHLPQDICKDCHASCATCSEGSYLNCSSCAPNFVFSSSAYCQSICGSGSYQDAGICMSCHPNCQACLSSTNCYVCNQNAIMIGTQCIFGSCISPCATCQGSQTSCLSCLSGYLYNSDCVQKCPQGSHPLHSKCQEVTQSPTYVPVTITGVVLVLAVLALRAYSSKKIGNQPRSSIIYTQTSVNSIQTNYKINILRVSSILWSYLEFIAAIVLIAKNSQFQVGISSTIVVIIGLILHLLSNIVFVIGFIFFYRKHQRNNTGPQTNSNEGMIQDQQADLTIRQKVVLILSFVISFRSYKLLYSNIFVDRTSKMRSVIVAKPPPVAQQVKQIQSPTLSKKRSLKSNNKSKQKQPKIQQKLPSRKPFATNTQQDQAPPIAQTVTSLNYYGQSRGLQFKRLVHPFTTYLTIINLILGSLMIIIGCAIQIMNSLFVNMLLWGIDCILVTVCAIVLVSWDLWVFVNLTKDQQQSQMSSKQAQQDNRGQVNNTHQNLKEVIQVEVAKPIANPSPKKKYGNKSSPLKKMSPNTIKKSWVQQVREIPVKDSKTGQLKQQVIPVLKAFDHFQDFVQEQPSPKRKPQQVESTQFRASADVKVKRMNVKKTRVSKANIKTKKNPLPSVSYQRQIHPGQCPDIYINFDQIEKQSTINDLRQNSRQDTKSNGNNKTSTRYDFKSNSRYDLKNKTRQQVKQKIKQQVKSVQPKSPLDSIRQGSIQAELVENIHYQQAPVFPDISDIEQVKVINLSLGSVMAPTNPLLQQKDKIVQQN